MTTDTLVATPDPPEPVEPTVSEPVPEPSTHVPTTPLETIDHWLNVSRYRNTYGVDLVQNILLDVRNAITRSES